MAILKKNTNTVTSVDKNINKMEPLDTVGAATWKTVWRLVKN